MDMHDSMDGDRSPGKSSYLITNFISLLQGIFFHAAAFQQSEDQEPLSSVSFYQHQLTLN